VSKKIKGAKNGILIWIKEIDLQTFFSKPDKIFLKKIWNRVKALLYQIIKKFKASQH
jgi:hypothetical protein